MIVKYEQVTGSPDVKIRGICEWLGIPFERAMLEVPMHNSSYNAFSRQAGISRAATDRWKTTLSRREIGIIQSVAGNALRSTGYVAENVHANLAELAIEYAKLPFAVARAAAANRDRMGNPFSYLTRRTLAALGRQGGRDAVS